MTAALLIPADGSRIIPVEFDPRRPEEWADMVGDPKGVDFITCREQGIQFVVGDTSLLDERPPNLRARWFLRGTGRWAISPVCGDVLMIGVDPGGDSADVPAPLLTALLGP